MPFENVLLRLCGILKYDYLMGEHPFLEHFIKVLSRTTYPILPQLQSYDFKSKIAVQNAPWYFFQNNTLIFSFRCL